MTIKVRMLIINDVKKFIYISNWWHNSFCNSFIPLTLKKYNPKRLVIFSRDENEAMGNGKIV